VDSDAKQSRASIWLGYAGEAVLWLLPVALALVGHLFAWPKAGLSGAGPGLYIVNMNEQTVRAQETWHSLNSYWWLFLAYAAVLVGTCILLKVRAVWWPARLAILAALAVPGLWYANLSSYLGGKIILF